MALLPDLLPKVLSLKRPVTEKFPFLLADSVFGLDPQLGQKRSGAGFSLPFMHPQMGRRTSMIPAEMSVIIFGNLACAITGKLFTKEQN